MQVILAVGTQKGAFVIRPGKEATAYAIHSQGLPGMDIRCLARNPGGGLLAGAANGLVYQSLDGSEWHPLLAGLEKPGVYSLSIHPAQPQTIYAGLCPAAVYRSRDGGQHWEPLREFNHVKGSDHWTYSHPPYMPKVRALCQHPEYPDVVFAGVKSGGLVASADGGNTWSERAGGLGRDINQLVVHPLAPSRVYAATDLGFYRSDDLGAHWTAYNKGLPYLFMYGLACHDEEPDLLVAGVNRGPTNGATLFRSRDGGHSWQICERFAPLEQASITCVSCSKGRFFVATDRGDIFGSEDLGERWPRMEAHFPAVYALLALA